MMASGLSRGLTRRRIRPGSAAIRCAGCASRASAWSSFPAAPDRRRRGTPGDHLGAHRGGVDPTRNRKLESSPSSSEFCELSLLRRCAPVGAARERLDQIAEELHRLRDCLNQRRGTAWPRRGLRSQPKTISSGNYRCPSRRFTSPSMRERFGPPGTPRRNRLRPQRRPIISARRLTRAVLLLAAAVWLCVRADRIRFRSTNSAGTARIGEGLGAASIRARARDSTGADNLRERSDPGPELLAGPGYSATGN